MENLLKRHRQIQFINKLFPSEWWDRFEEDPEIYVETLLGQLLLARVTMGKLAAKYNFSMEDIDSLRNKSVIDIDSYENYNNNL